MRRSGDGRAAVLTLRRFAKEALGFIRGVGGVAVEAAVMKACSRLFRSCSSAERATLTAGVRPSWLDEACVRETYAGRPPPVVARGSLIFTFGFELDIQN